MVPNNLELDHLLTQEPEVHYFYTCILVYIMASIQWTEFLISYIVLNLANKNIFTVWNTGTSFTKVQIII